jgi:hypothetical protein
MRFKSTFKTLFAALFIAACAVVASAQTTQVEGTVKLKQADGTEVPVVGAQVDIYRTDIKSDYHVKTDKKGHYLHAGLPFVGTYTIIVSAPGAQPAYASGLRFTQVQEKDFTLSPGDGSTLTLDKVKALEAGGGARTGGTPPAGESKEAKAAREELERKNKEIEEKNKKITEGNEIVSRTFKAGNDALAAKNYDAAIAAYNEGLAARPDEPALLMNLSDALRRRGVDRFNAAIKNPDNDAKTQGLDAAKKDWTDAAANADKAVALIKAVPATEAASQQGYEQNKRAAFSTRALVMRLVATKVDQSKAQEAYADYQEYMGTETDPAKKAALRAEALQMLFDANALDLAIAEARKILAENPDDVDANRIMGLALISNNTTNDKAKFQEASNYLQHYVDKAPDSDPLKASTKEALDYLKANENVKPEKTTTRQPARKH